MDSLACLLNTHTRTHTQLTPFASKVDKPENGDPNIYISDVDDAGAAREAGMSNPTFKKPTIVRCNSRDKMS